MANSVQFIEGLKKQRELLDGLITNLKGKQMLNEIDSHFYDITTRRVESSLRQLRKSFLKEAVQTGGNKNEK